MNSARFHLLKYNENLKFTLVKVMPIPYYKYVCNVSALLVCQERSKAFSFAISSSLVNAKTMENAHVLTRVLVLLTHTEIMLSKTIIGLIIKNTISSIVIGLKKLLFSTNSLAKLLSDSLLSDSSTSQSHSKL